MRSDRSRILASRMMLTTTRRHFSARLGRLVLAMSIVGLLAACGGSTIEARLPTPTPTRVPDLPVVIGFYQCFDLDQGVVTAGDAQDSNCDQGWDFYFKRVPSSKSRAILVQNQEQGVHTDYATAPYSEIDQEDVGSFILTPNLKDVPFDQVAILLTGFGDQFKVGPLSETIETVKFQWDRLF